jgi:tRNA-splicing ligase RtcB
MRFRILGPVEVFAAGAWIAVPAAKQRALLATLILNVGGVVSQGLGTVGRGNHFVELARIETVLEPREASRFGLAANDLVLIVHSGSRGLGERILRAHTEAHGAGPAP